jgi:hypothetical protein
VLTSGGSNVKAVTNLAYVLYVALWNAMIGADKQATKSSGDELFTRSECRLTALELLGIAMKDLSMSVSRTSGAISKVSLLITTQPSLKQKAFALVDAMVKNALKVVCQSQESVCEHIVQLLISQLQLLLQFDGFTEALSVSSGVRQLSDYMTSKNGFSPFLDVISEILSIAVHARQLRLHLVQNKDIGNTSGINRSTARCGKLLGTFWKTPCELEFSQPLLHTASYTLDFLYQVVQNISHMKIATDSSRLIFKTVVDFSASMATVCEDMVPQLKLGDKSHTQLWRRLLDCQVLHLKAVYYFLTLFIQGV